MLGLVLAAAASCRGGCSSPRPTGRPLEGRLALFPFDTRVVAAVDFARLRASPLAGALAQLGQDAPADQQIIHAFTQRTGLDPWRDLQSLVVGFPEDARQGGRFGLILRANALDQKRLIGFVSDDAAQKGHALTSTARGRQTLWSRKGEPDLAGFFLDQTTFVLGAGGWAEQMADLADGGAPAGSAATNLDLVRLCERTAGQHAIWAAAMIPAQTRQLLAADPRFTHAASMTHLGAAVDLDRGFDATVLADVGSPADAQGLATQAVATLRDARSNPEVLMLGLAPYLDGVTATARGNAFELHAVLGEPQVKDLLGRAAAFLQLIRQGGLPGPRRP